MKFDPAEFGRLSGLDLGNYTINVANDPLLEETLIGYFQQAASSMDLAHLESGLYLLSKIHSKTSYRMLAKFLDHHATSARFIAVKAILSLSAVDEEIMKMVTKALLEHGDKMVVDELTAVLERPANEAARHVVEEYRAECGQ